MRKLLFVAISLIISQYVQSFTIGAASGRSNTGTRLAAKPKKKSQKRDEIPANLRRKVSAKRDPLGHVIPAEFKTGGKWKAIEVE